MWGLMVNQRSQIKSGTEQELDFGTYAHNCWHYDSYMKPFDLQ